MPTKLSGRIRYEKRLYKMGNPKRDLLEELACEAEALEKQCDNCIGNIGRTLKIQEEWEAKQSQSALKVEQETTKP